MLNAVIYVGPSLTIADFDAYPRDCLDFRPPIKRGELLPAVAAGHRLIGIIDGNFLQDIAVSPKEVWRALESGVTIFGGASMGALRAVELCSLGMIGVGQIFEWYRSGRLNRDDDVGVMYTVIRNRYRLLTVPMVNVIWVVDQALLNGFIDDVLAQNVLERARSIDWRERTWQAIWDDDRLRGALSAEFREFAANPNNDLKRLDAKLVIDTILNLVLGLRVK